MSRGNTSRGRSLEQFCTQLIRGGLAVLALALFGCNGDADKESIRETTANSATTVATSSGTDSTISLKTIDKAGLDAAIQANAGKAVLVDFWATWCGPCKEQFPHTVELSRKYQDQGLTVISMSCDEASEEKEDQAQTEANVLAFLREQGADFENFVPAMGFDPFEAFDFKAIPYYLIYDRQGKLVKAYPEGEQSADPEEIEAIVKQALAQQESK